MAPSVYLSHHAWGPWGTREQHISKQQQHENKSAYVHNQQTGGVHHTPQPRGEGCTHPQQDSVSQIVQSWVTVIFSDTWDILPIRVWWICVRRGLAVHLHGSIFPEILSAQKDNTWWWWWMGYSESEHQYISLKKQLINELINITIYY